MAANGRLNMVVAPTEVIWKWQQYGIDAFAIFRLSRARRSCFLIYLMTIQWQVIEVKVTFNELSFEQILHIWVPTKKRQNRFRRID